LQNALSVGDGHRTFGGATENYQREDEETHTCLVKIFLLIASISISITRAKKARHPYQDREGGN
jgi:hypothetical protein